MLITKINYNTIHSQYLHSLSRKSISFCGENSDNFSNRINNKQNPTFDYLKKHLEKNPTLKDKFLFQCYQNKQINNAELLFLIDNYADKLSFVDFKLFAQNEIPLTKFDDEKILKSRKLCVEKVFVTPDMEEYTKNFERILNHNYQKLKDIPTERKIILVSGLPGSGKNTIINKYYSEQYYLADPDNIKQMFPSHKTKGRLDNSLHKVAKKILFDYIVPTAFNEGKNIIIPTTGLKDDLIFIGAHAKINGYRVKVILVKTDKEEAIKRAIHRYNTGGRYTDPVFILKRAQHINIPLEELSKLPFFDEVVQYDN